MSEKEEYDFLEEEGNELDEARELLAVIGDIPSNMRGRVSVVIQETELHQTEKLSDS